MCRERRRTRDLLLEYDPQIMPLPHHRAGGLSIVYPWENTDIVVFEEQFFKLACEHGYNGTRDEFWNIFFSNNIISDDFANFPVPGHEHDLYFDYNTGIVYCFRNIVDKELLGKLIRLGGTVVGQSEDEQTTYLYIPIQTLLIENTVLYGGDARG